MLQFNNVNGQSFIDICLNTYGSLDYLSKLLTDNGIESIDDVPPASKTWHWDETLVSDERANIIQTNQQIYFATSSDIAGNVLSIIVNDESNSPYQNPWLQDVINTAPLGGGGTMNYMKTSDLQYTASGGETGVTNSVLIGAEIIQITREMLPLKTSEFTFNQYAGTITLVSDTLETGETLYVIYNKLTT